jgi:hypothetical protein
MPIPPPAASDVVVVVVEGTIGIGGAAALELLFLGVVVKEFTVTSWRSNVEKKASSSLRVIVADAGDDDMIRRRREIIVDDVGGLPSRFFLW